MTSDNRSRASDGAPAAPARAVGVFHAGDPSGDGIPILPPDPEGTVYRRLDSLRKPEKADDR